jgi:hypothetical protein
MQSFRLQVLINTQAPTRRPQGYYNYLLFRCLLAVENEHLRALLTYLNNTLQISSYLLGRTSIRSIVMSEFSCYQRKVIDLLAAAPGKFIYLQIYGQHAIGNHCLESMRTLWMLIKHTNRLF